MDIPTVVLQPGYVACFGRNDGLFENVRDYPGCEKNADGFDRILQQYLGEYEKAGLRPARYADVDEFVAAYMRNCDE